VVPGMEYLLIYSEKLLPHTNTEKTTHRKHICEYIRCIYPEIQIYILAITITNTKNNIYFALSHTEGTVNPKKWMLVNFLIAILPVCVHTTQLLISLWKDWENYRHKLGVWME